MTGLSFCYWLSPTHALPTEKSVTSNINVESIVYLKLLIFSFTLQGKDIYLNV